MSKAPPWTADDVPDQTGRLALVTGANSGIGLETARVLVGRGARVLMACRNPEKGADAQQEIGSAHVELLELDLADLASVRSAASRVLAEHDRLDLLINNAGIMAVPEGRTPDGFELQLGTNHLGHFALTGLLVERLLETPGSRVVNVSSGAHRWGDLDFDDLQWERRTYKRFGAYGSSKLANLLFTLELQRRFDVDGAKSLAVSAHPGIAKTNLARRPAGSPGAWRDSVMRLFTGWMLQDAAMGALPTLRAATDPDVLGGEYYGPDGRGELGGHPVKVPASTRAQDAERAARLWRVSEQLTGVSFPL
jgi:NAD(P)-dependent dehydrogenase (short-subunit alcohol dehydrogenase family)